MLIAGCVQSYFYSTLTEIIQRQSHDIREGVNHRGLKVIFTSRKYVIYEAQKRG